MNRTEVVKKLNNRGFNAQERDVVRNLYFANYLHGYC